MTAETGSGFVHIAPGHGQDDYNLGRANGLPLYERRFSPEELRGADEARMEQARDKMLSVTRGWEQARVSGIVRETFETIVAPFDGTITERNVEQGDLITTGSSAKPLFRVIGLRAGA